MSRCSRLGWWRDEHSISNTCKETATPTLEPAALLLGQSGSQCRRWENLVFAAVAVEAALPILNRFQPRLIAAAERNSAWSDLECASQGRLVSQSVQPNRQAGSGPCSILIVTEELHSDTDPALSCELEYHPHLSRELRSPSRRFCFCDSDQATQAVFKALPQFQARVANGSQRLSQPFQMAKGTS